MAKLTLEELQEMCKRNLNERHVREVLEIISKSEFRFHPGIVQPQDSLASLYKLRLEILKGKGTTDIDFLDDYERTVSKLQMSKSNSLAITSLLLKDLGFVIFYEPETKTILEVIKGKTNSEVSMEAHET